MDNEAAIRLIELYHSYSPLWDRRRKQFHNKNVREDIWDIIANEFVQPKEVLKTKMKSLLSTYRRERNREKTTIITGYGRQQAYKSRWFAYESFRFLRDRNNPIDTDETKNDVQKSEESEQSSEEDDGVDNDDNDDNDDNEDMEVIIKQEPVAETYRRDHRKTIKRRRVINPRPGSIKPLLKRRIIKEQTIPNTNNLDSKLIETLKLLKKSDLSKRKDECDSFGEYIAISLRKHDDRTQSMIKQAINNILFEQEMKKYSTGQYTVVIAGVDENPLVLSNEK